MRMLKIWASVAVLSSVIVGCAPITADISSEQSKHQEPIVIRVSGYGTYGDARDRLQQRQRLMAMRASKLDAYRALVERVYGTSLSGSSSVQQMVLQDDRYRTMVDSVIRGARVVSVTELSGGGFETVLELVLEGRFRDCITNVNYFKYSDECRMQLPLSGTGASGEDVVLSPTMFRELSAAQPRTLDSAPAAMPAETGTYGSSSHNSNSGGSNASGLRPNQYYHIGKDK